MSYRPLLAAALAVWLLAPSPSLAAGVEERFDGWFVELASAPVSEGGSPQALAREKDEFRAAAGKAGLRYEEEFAYSQLWNGLALEIAPEELARLATLPGVKAIHPVLEVRPALATAVTLTGADVARSSLGYTGAGVRVGIIDSGIDYHHPDLGGCFGPGCRVATGFDFVEQDGDPDDCSGHGTHVAGIVGASGGVVGVAPGVSFGAYRVFDCLGGAPSSRIIAAMERAYVDGMQVVNMSLGAPNQWPQHPLGAAATRLVNAGVVVVASIGNEGEGLWSGSAPGLGAKVIGVAAAENGVLRLTHFTVSPDATPIGYVELIGSGESPTSGSFPMARTGTPASEEDACSPLPPASLAGAVALVRRGTCTFSEKAANAVAAGAVAVVIYNDLPGLFSGFLQSFVAYPVLGISEEQGLLLDQRLASGSVQMTWQPGTAVVPNGRSGLLADFSSLGTSPDLAIKPDLTAPGGAIHSTYPLELGGTATLSGTSMASPHVAGAAALLLEAHPRMPSQIVGAVLQNSADPAPWTVDPTLGRLDHVHRQGAGMLDIDDAILATVRIEPSELPLGEGESGPVTRTLRLENEGSQAVAFDLSSQSAMATLGVISVLEYYESTETVVFSDASGSIDSVTVPAGGQAEVRVTVTPGADGAGGRGLYGGYVFFTPRNGGPRLSVPYLGVEGDYQEIVVYARPGLPSLTNADLEPDDHFTLVGDDRPTFLVHLRHQVRRLRFEVFATSGKSWHRAAPDFEYFPRNTFGNSFFRFAWDARTIAGKKTTVLPDGDYLVVVSVLKANGDDEDPEHWESATLGPLTIERAAAPAPTPTWNPPAGSNARRRTR